MDGQKDKGMALGKDGWAARVDVKMAVRMDSGWL